MQAPLAEAAWLATVILAGLAVGSLGLLLLGRLLGRDWLTPIDDELEPAALTLPLVALAAGALALAYEPLYGARTTALPSTALEAWYEPGAFLARSAICFAAWSVVAFAIAGRRDDVPASALGVAVLLPTVSLAGVDWVLGREPFWWSSVFGFAFAISQLAPALALAFLANAVQREHVARLHDRSLTSALLTLALATLGVWFVQFLTAWMGNLPEAAAWYEARFADGRGAVLLASAAMLVAAVALLLQRHRGPATAVIAAVFVLVQHVLHTAWLLRPLGRAEPSLLDLGVLAVLAGVWTLPYALLVRRRERHAPQSTSPGSS